MTSERSPIRRTVVVATNSAWNISNFRAPLVTALCAEGWRVVALAPDDGYADAVRALGAEFVPISIDSSGTSLLRDARLLADYVAKLRSIQPDAFLGFTIKPNVYGSIAARLLGIKVINNISGLGTAFMQPGLLNQVVRRLYRFALGGSSRVFFQNNHDRDMFVEGRLVRKRQSEVIPGSGIDLQRFQPSSGAREKAAPFRYLFVGRLLRDKGLVEYAEAARLLRKQWPQVEFAILGFAGSDNRTAVPIEQVERWQDENVTVYLGDSADVRPFIAEADCVVLPSYREGLPRSLLEAAAMAKPIVATDVPGCRDIVTEGENGFLCAARSVASLAQAMERMLALEPAQRAAMGRRGREKVEKEFDQKLVVDAYLGALG